VQKIASYFSALNQTLLDAEVSLADGRSTSLAEAVDLMGADMRQAHGAGRKVMFVGNGGSAGICSHMATDYSKNGKIRSMAFNDSRR
jgi:D-sedoheptulose 7-phosphate isomerase